MMGAQDPPQGKLYYTNFNLDQRIRTNHPLRKIDQLIDFDFVYHESGGPVWVQRQRLRPSARHPQAHAAFGLLQCPL